MRIELEATSSRRRRRRRRAARPLPILAGGRPPRRQRRGFLGPAAALLAVLVVVAGAYVAFALLRSLPAPSVSPLSVMVSATPAHSAALPAWPAQGEAAVGIEGQGLLGIHGAQRPVAIASVTKIMTALIVLTDHPLRGSQSGPAITITPADTSVYRADAAAGQSVLPVRAGERLTERQALEGLLLPSGNNIATLLAAWDAGRQSTFVARMNARARALGLTHTHYTGASGVAAATVSTAEDQTRLAEAAMANPVFRAIVAMPQATLPVAGRQYNVDALLGHDGIVGIKTGTTSNAGGCFVFAARRRVGRSTRMIIGAVLGQRPSRGDPSIITAAFRATTRVLGSLTRVLRPVTVVSRGSTLGQLRTPWNGSVPLSAARPVTVTALRTPTPTVRLLAPARIRFPLRAGAPVGRAVVSAAGHSATVELLAAKAVPAASAGWRLRHP